MIEPFGQMVAHRMDRRIPAALPLGPSARDKSKMKSIFVALSIGATLALSACDTTADDWKFLGNAVGTAFSQAAQNLPGAYPSYSSGQSGSVSTGGSDSPVQTIRGSDDAPAGRVP
jgi:hypothetical protein